MFKHFYVQLFITESFNVLLYVYECVITRSTMTGYNRILLNTGLILSIEMLRLRRTKIGAAFVLCVVIVQGFRLRFHVCPQKKVSRGLREPTTLEMLVMLTQASNIIDLRGNHGPSLSLFKYIVVSTICLEVQPLAVSKKFKFVGSIYILRPLFGHGVFNNNLNCVCIQKSQKPEIKHKF